MSNFRFACSSTLVSRLYRALAIGVYSVTSMELCFLKRSIARLCMSVATGCSQILVTDSKCRVVVTHSSKLLDELNAHRALQCCHVLMIHLIIFSHPDVFISSSLSAIHFWTFFTITVHSFGGGTSSVSVATALHFWPDTFSAHVQDGWSRGIIIQEIVRWLDVIMSTADLWLVCNYPINCVIQRFSKSLWCVISLVNNMVRISCSMAANPWPVIKRGRANGCCWDEWLDGWNSTIERRSPVRFPACD